MREGFGPVAKRWTSEVAARKAGAAMAEALDSALLDVLNERLGFLKWGAEDIRGRVRIIECPNLCKETHYFLDGELVLRTWTWWEGGEMAWKVVRV